MVVTPSVRAGLVAGSVAAVAGALVQLPLHSPADSFFNAGTVVAGALAAGVLAGVVVDFARRASGGLRLLWLVWACGFGAVVLLAVAGESQLDRTVSYVVPLAALVLGTTGALTPWLAQSRLVRHWLPVAAAAAVAVGVGAGLAGQGDQPSGRLELPPRDSRP